ncbi:MAG: alpha/beta fold hydrolase [Myxococcales bacterium]|nr:alpha/beta fold hydrolase [Myxococcales bacterium]
MTQSAPERLPWIADLPGAPRVAPTPRDVVHTDGKAKLYRFRDPAEQEGREKTHAPVLVVPSMINRWYVVDLREGASLMAALSHDRPWETFCLDWGIPEDEDRYVEWDEIVKKLARAIAAVRRITGAPKVSLVGYCMGATLTAIQAALEPHVVAALVDLLGPIDFEHSGRLGTMVDKRWFDAEAVAAAGNVSATQMQSGFLALAPTTSVSKWVGFADRGHEPRSREAFLALETWASDNIPFPAAAYRRYIGELYQQNQLARGEHHVAGKRVDLKRITCPVLAVVAERDAICPPKAATALLDLCGAQVKDVLSVPGGHVGAVVGSRAQKDLYPRMAAWLTEHTRRDPPPASRL